MSASQPLTVMQPVIMTTAQNQRTTTYLQHSFAPISASGVPGQPAFQVNGAFPVVGTQAPEAFPHGPIFPLFISPNPNGGPPLVRVESAVSVFPAPSSAASAPSTQDAKAVDAKVPTTYAELKHNIAEQKGSIILPPQTSISADVVPLDSVIHSFVRGTNNNLLDTFALIEYTCRQAASIPPSEGPGVPMLEVAKHFLNFMSAVNQLPGWNHVERYIRSPSQYSGGLPGTPGKTDELTSKGNALILRIFGRLNWVLSLQKEQKQVAEPDILMRVISADRIWANDSMSFMKEAENFVTAMLTENQPKFHAFRELQRKGVQWPHSPQARLQIEAAGFVYRPMMIKRDRCLCETCQVELSGFRPWQNVWAFHDYSRHSLQFLEKARLACASDTVVMVVLNEAKARLSRPKPPVPLFNDAPSKT
jgi:hypothetical protein